jgi:hypothetical protein
MSALFFGLGVAAAVVVIFLTALVVVTFKLMKEVRLLKESDTDDRRNLASEVGSLVTMIDNSCNAYLESAKKYTDSRLDKVLEKISK